MIFSIYSNMLELCVRGVINILFIPLRQLHYNETPMWFVSCISSLYRRKVILRCLILITIRNIYVIIYMHQICTCFAYYYFRFCDKGVVKEEST